MFDYIAIKNDALRRAKSDSAYTEEERENVMKKVEPEIDELYKAGKIPEEKYRKYKALLEVK